MKNKCPVCGGTDITIEEKDYPFVESGLDNVILIGVKVIDCHDCSEEFVSIPNVAPLMDIIAEQIILKAGRLTGKEIRFLRKTLLLNISEFATLLGVDRVSLSRWENDQVRPTTSNDRLIRLTYTTCKKIADSTREKLIERLRDRSFEEIEAAEPYFVSASSVGVIRQEKNP